MAFASKPHVVGVTSIKFVNCHQFRQSYREQRARVRLRVYCFGFFFFCCWLWYEPCVHTMREETMKFSFPLFEAYNSLWLLHRLHYISSGSKLSSNLRSPQKQYPKLSVSLFLLLLLLCVELHQRMTHRVKSS